MKGRGGQGELCVLLYQIWLVWIFNDNENTLGIDIMGMLTYSGRGGTTKVGLLHLH